MKIKPPFLEVKPAEQVTITITAVGTPYQAAEPDDISPASWVSRTGPNPRVLVLKAPDSGPFPVVLNFGFIPDATGAIPAGAQYTVTIAGDPAEDTRRMTIAPPPNDQSKSIDFTVSAVQPAPVPPPVQRAGGNG